MNETKKQKNVGKRIVIDDKVERYLTEDIYQEGKRWDGRNNISLATGDQFVHEELLVYTMVGGETVFYLYGWSQWQGSTTSKDKLTKKEAEAWLVKNEYDDEKIDEILGEKHDITEQTAEEICKKEDALHWEAGKANLALAMPTRENVQNLYTALVHTLQQERNRNIEIKQKMREIIGQ